MVCDDIVYCQEPSKGFEVLEPKA